MMAFITITESWDSSVGIVTELTCWTTGESGILFPVSVIHSVRDGYSDLRPSVKLEPFPLGP
jgi:hypothetical protein